MRSVNPDHLRALTIIDELGSISAAAKQLNLSQPAVSLQIRELEARVGVKLLERVGNKVYLTPAGRELIVYARELWNVGERAYEAMRRYKEGWIGRVHLGTDAAVLKYLLRATIARLRVQHPKIELAFSTGPTSRIIAQMMANVVDLGFVTEPATETALTVTPVLREPLVAIFPVSERRLPPALTGAALIDRPLVMLSSTTNISRLVWQWWRAAGYEPRPTMELDDLEAIKGVVAAGCGVAIVPASCASRERDGLKFRPLDPPLLRTLSIIQRSDKPDNEAIAIMRQALLQLREPGLEKPERVTASKGRPRRPERAESP